MSRGPRPTRALLLPDPLDPLGGRSGACPALRDDFTQESDIDALVEFGPGTSVGWAFVAMQDELSEILGRKVDLNTEGFLGRHLRDRAEAKDLHVAA